jgi:hypothetical protein
MSGRIIFSDKLGEDGAVAVTLGWLVAPRLDVTINVFETELDPWVAATWANPKDDDKGTVKLAKNSPLLLVVTVVISVSLNVRTTVELGSNPIPVIFTEAPTGPEIELSVMVGTPEDVTVNVFDDELDLWVALGFPMSVTLNVFEAELDPWLASTVWSPIDEVEGTLRVALNPPLEVDVTVSLVSPSKLITTVEKGSNPLPVTVTKVATGPEDGLSEMVGLPEPDVLIWFFSLSAKTGTEVKPVVIVLNPIAIKTNEKSVIFDKFLMIYCK